MGCISPLSYIKPQRVSKTCPIPIVVYLLYPTSNRNPREGLAQYHGLYISFILHQTATSAIDLIRSPLLYISFILHQTATAFSTIPWPISCISPLSYIKPQPLRRWSALRLRCISPLSYIKPQPVRASPGLSSCCISPLSYIKPQRNKRAGAVEDCCISPLSYIKPQPCCPG